ncbi:stage III sporulation protein AB [Intestinibacter sp.]|uniref:stage III sporulation protein AB n=1 Tax=Intestinibacter sp. TaxID=1965304 RepID=UPI002A75F321|nr:stage III sporulation protein AB [Intestinibacter sp.]MDY2734360.1 stage III sporulation protein AB [Intestinibacter sp.]MDY4575205.1 stage III sporulation protein AB [Intestinibacter sp.]
MQIKIFLVGMLIGCSYLLGEEISKRYIKRNRQLNDLIRILEIIRMDLSFGMYTLEEIFRNISLKDEYDFKEFFSSFADSLLKEDGKRIEDILEENIDILYRNTYLRKNEIEELRKLILSLGKSELESQERLIDLTVENLKKLTVESKDDIKNKGNLYKKLIVFSGICIGIILI